MPDLPLGVSLPRLPTLDELTLIITGQAADHHQWPPPGMAQVAPFTQLAYALTGRPTEQGWWWARAEQINPEFVVVEDILFALTIVGIEISAAVRTAVRALGWVPLVYEGGPAMEWIKIGILAELGTAEQMVHTLALTPSGATPVPMPADDAELRVVATQVATAWLGMLGLTATAPIEQGGFNTTFGGHAVYTAVTAAVLRQTEPSPKVYVKGQPNLITTVVPTTRVNVSMRLPGYAVGNAMPYEVACALTLLTRSAGPTNRGRLYLGGMTVEAVSGVDGLFTASYVHKAGWGVGKFFEAMRTDTDWQVSIVSRRALTSHEVTRVMVGRVPDAQRRRRASQQENRTESWVSPTV